MKDLKAAYKTIEADHFAPKMEISFIDGDSRPLRTVKSRYGRLLLRKDSFLDKVGQCRCRDFAAGLYLLFREPPSRRGLSCAACVPSPA